MFTYARLYIHNRKMVSSTYFKRPLVQHEQYNSTDMQSAHVAHLHALYNRKRVFSFSFCIRTAQKVGCDRQMVLSTHTDDIFPNIFIQFITELNASHYRNLFPGL